MADALNLQNALNLARNVPALAATVTVVDDAGKVVTTSKNIFGAFKSAREAYKARKAEITAERNGEATHRREARLRETRRIERRERRLLEDVEDGGKKDKKKSSKSRKHRTSSEEDDASSSAVTRRGSTDTVTAEPVYSQATMAMIHNNASLLSLAPAALLAGGDPLADTLQMLLMQLQNTIDEMSCITAGIGALISELQKVPDTLAVVGLTLAEISAIIAKISPAAIMGMKSAFPVIFGLLSSPQFAIVAGVGMAATVVVLGGYRIIKNVVGVGAPATKTIEEEEEEEEEELVRDLDVEFGVKVVPELPDEIEEPASAPSILAPLRMIMPPPPPMPVERRMSELSIQDDPERERERRRTKRRDSERSVKAVKSEKSLKSVSSEGSGKDRKDRPAGERRESSRKVDKGERRERSERGDKRERGEKRDRSERRDGVERRERGDRSERSSKSDRSERGDKKKEKESIIAPSKFSLIRRATAPAQTVEPSRPSFSKRTMTALSTTSKSDEKPKTPKKKLLGSLFDGHNP